MVGVVEEEHQIAEADQGIGALAGRREVPAVPVYVTDHMHAHDVTLSRRGGGREGWWDLGLLSGHRPAGLVCAGQSPWRVPQRVTHRTSGRSPLSREQYPWVTSGQSTLPPA
ncbi:hypothetical protein GCM10012285_30230 [Streptomyces kronopolitis]|uniref:Uncharacterized protein n=1 Tax=Streptomyces kronopolitis TaxID=1612435 RepID=A0ABQ2JEP4_9ACTN|nr:hypothetical protein GCM10012285_30230 [Streptomyces kronopolitis]